MSRQLIDTVQRILDNSFSQIDKGQYKKALENLAKAEKLLEKTTMPEFLCQALMLKGRALLASGREEEALAEFQGVLELSVPRLLEDAENTDYQYFVYNAIGFTVKTLREIDSDSKTQELFDRNKKYFEEILAAYKGLLAEDPENFEYIMDYLNTLENILAYYLGAKQYEKYAYFTDIIVQNYGKALKIQSDNDELFDKLGIHIRKFIRYCLLLRKPEEAKEVLEQAEEIYRGILEKEPGNSLAFDDLISLYEEFGDLYASIGDVIKTEETFLRALDLLEEKLLKQPGDISNIQTQSEILRGLSRSLSREDTKKAGQYAEKALEILKELAGKNPEDLDYQYELSDGFNELGELFGDMCDIEHAKVSLMKEIEIYRHIHEKDPEDLESVENIAAAFEEIGSLYADEGETESAKHYYEQGIETYEKLLESNPGNLDSEIGIADSLNYIGELYKYPEPETARSYFEKALAINEKAVKQFPESTSYREDLIYTLKNLASISTRQNEYGSAIQLHERITEIRREMVIENPGNYEYETALGVSYSELGLLLEKAEQPEFAKQQYSKAVEIFRNILQNEEIEPLIKQMLAAELRMKVALFTHSKKHYIAREYLELIHDYYKSLYENDPESPVGWKGLYEAQLLDGKLQESIKNYRIAAEKYESVFPILQKHLESDPENPEYQEKASFAYTQLGIVYLLADEREKSKEAFEKAIPLSTKLLEKDPEDPLYIGDVASTFEEYAKLLRKLDRNEEAEEYSAKAEGLKEKLKEKKLEEDKLEEKKVSEKDS
jgi:tetratricopeptide (TPR) repeat protein